ncbi:hypothetical protein [Amphibacillus marinus]|nr:hypothetical protein [Amphibacillus marinus]
MARGDKGNTLPKYGNKISIRHGLYSAFQLARVQSDGYLYIHLS